MKTQARIKYLKISARKLRLSADPIRGIRVQEAEQRLAAMPHKGAVMVAEALKSVVANAENNNNIRKSALHISQVKVDEGPKLKRFRPRSRGMANPILHRMAHLTLIVSDEDLPKVVKPKRYSASKSAVNSTKSKTTEPAKVAKPTDTTDSKGETK